MQTCFVYYKREKGPHLFKCWVATRDDSSIYWLYPTVVMLVVIYTYNGIVNKKFASTKPNDNCFQQSNTHIASSTPTSRGASAPPTPPRWARCLRCTACSPPTSAAASTSAATRWGVRWTATGPQGRHPTSRNPVMPGAERKDSCCWIPVEVSVIELPHVQTCSLQLALLTKHRCTFERKRLCAMQTELIIIPG